MAERTRDSLFACGYRALMAVVSLAIVGSCAKAPTTAQLAADAAAAMGGVDALRAVQTLQMRGGSGKRWRHGQVPKIGEMEAPATLSNVVETIDLAGGRAALDYEFAITGFSQHRQEVLTTRNGKAVGLENVAGRPLAVMSPGGLFSWATQNDPAMLLRRNIVTVLLAAVDSAAEEAPQNRDRNGVALKYGRATLASGEAVGLYFDPASKLVTAFETTDAETMLGDVPSVYALADYRQVGEVRLPHKVSITKGGQPYADVQFTSASVNDAATGALFTIPGTARAEVDKAVAADEYSPITLVKVADGVMLAQAYSHHSLVVEFPTFLAVVEAPYTEAQTATLLRELAAQFPGKPVRYAAPTHHHYDHIGGVRGMAAAGATILVDQGHEPALRALLDSPHAAAPDALEKKKQARQPVGAIESYNGTRRIVEGSQVLELHGLTGNPHSDPIVIAYLPPSRVAFESDIWIPGIGLPANAESAHLLASIESRGLRVETHAGGHGAVGSHDELVKAVAALKQP